MTFYVGKCLIYFRISHSMDIKNKVNEYLTKKIFDKLMNEYINRYSKNV